MRSIRVAALGWGMQQHERRGANQNGELDADDLGRITELLFGSLIWRSAIAAETLPVHPE